MRFSTAALVLSATTASAAVIRRDEGASAHHVAARDYCPVVQKTTVLTWITLEQFSKVEVFAPEKLDSIVADSKPDDSMVYPELGNGTYSRASSSAGGYPTGGSQTSANKATTSAPAAGYSTVPITISGSVIYSTATLSYSTAKTTTGSVASVSSGTPGTSAGQTSYSTATSKPVTSTSSGLPPPPPASGTSSSTFSTMTFSNATTTATGSSTSGSATITSTSVTSKTTTTTAGSTSLSTGGTSTTSAAITTSTAATTTSKASTTSSSSSTTSASASATCASPRTRKEWRSLTDGEKDTWVAGLKCLMNTPSTNPAKFPGSGSLWEDLTSLHQQQINSIHWNGHFLVWHRYFLHTLEALLSQRCGYSGPFVWWNEALDAGKFSQAPMFTSRWYGALPAAQGDKGVCITESGWGAFTVNIGPGSAVNNPHCLSRAVSEDNSRGCAQSEVDRCMGSQNYDAYRTCNENGIHGAGHNGVGSIMADIYASPSDPSFYLHHAFVDRNYKTWQKGKSTRDMEIGGPSPAGPNVKSLPSDVLTSMGLIPDATIADVLNTAGDYLCYVYDS